MGVSMCSISNEERGDIDEFQYDMQWDTSEEQEDTDDDSEYFNLGKMGRCMSLPDIADLEKETPRNRTKTGGILRSRGFSFQKKMIDWDHTSVVNPEAELQARRWCKMVTDDTLKHISHSVHIAGTIVEKGVAINNELARHDSLLSKAETGTSLSKYETEQVAETLKGMRSLRSKLKNFIWKKEPKFKMEEFDSKTGPFNKVNLDLFEENVGSCSPSKTECKPPTLTKDTSNDMQQIQIKTGIGQLRKALDIIAVQQMDVAWALDTHEERLTMLENQWATTNEKINRQTRMIWGIMGRSEILSFVQQTDFNLE